LASAMFTIKKIRYGKKIPFKITNNQHYCHPSCQHS
jgi:hypothetical protein